MHVYAIEAPSGLVKIGKSGNPDRRVNELCLAGGFAPKAVWYSVPVVCADIIETTAHASLQTYREMGEWFRVGFDSAVAVIEPLVPMYATPSTWRVKVKAIMRSRGIKQVDLYPLLGVKKTTFSHWMVGRYEPSIAQFAALARAIGTTPNDLLGFSESCRAPE